MESRKALRSRRESLIFSFGLIFGILTIISLVICSVATYVRQTITFKQYSLDNCRSIGDYLEKLIQDSGEEFVVYQNYYMEHFAQADIPYDFKNYQDALKRYEDLLRQSDSSEMNASPGNHYGTRFDDLSDEAQMAFFIYLHEFWLTTFERARESFNLPYTYYLVPKEDIFHMVYMIDGERSHRGADGSMAEEGEFLYLGDEYYDDPEKYKVQWDTWFTGKRQDDFQVWDNEWGHTYAYYTPLIINGKKMGLIGTEVQVEDVNKAILKNSLVLAGGIGVCLVICIVIALLFINRHFIERIGRLELDMREFASKKNPMIADRIEKSVKGNNEISSLARQFSEMIMELEQYMKNLVSTSRELKNTKEWADEMQNLANKDSLTGIKNKTAYDNEIRRLEWKLADGEAQFGIAMIDLNFLKRINDTFGHEQGNVAIKKLCMTVCEVFEKSLVFRIGGDEFVVVLEHDDYKDVDRLVKVFNDRIEAFAADDSLEPWEQVSAAIGYALFDSSVDGSVANVFRRADKNMYARKKEMKAVRES